MAAALPACDAIPGPNTSGLREHYLVPTLVASDLLFTSIAASGHHTCATATDGLTYCWGGNPVGELGTDAVTDTCRDGLSTSFWSRLTCGITADDEVYCWGVASGGMLGNGVRDSWENVPVRAATELGLGVVSIGSTHACGITPASEAYCWGGNWYGQAGGAPYCPEAARLC